MLNRPATRYLMLTAVVTAVVTAASVGCTAVMSPDKTMQTQTQRPVELDNLKMFEGRWEGTGEVRAGGSDEAIPLKGSWRAGLECDGWHLVSREEIEVGDAGKTEGMGIWTWDARCKKYRTRWFGAQGAWISATTTYDAPTRTWRLRFTGDSPSGPVVGRGRLKMIDGDTMEWSWVEWRRWDILRLFRTTELTGTYRRSESR